MANNPAPQRKFYDDQNVFTIDINKMFDNFITPIDQIRNNVNILGQTPDQVASIDYQESRCSAFYRMIGFPVTSNSTNGSFYSPGFDPNLNTNINALNVNQNIANTVFKDTHFIQSQLNVREGIYKTYNTVFANGGINAIAVCLGSIYIRDLSEQFDDKIGPLITDPTQIQNISTRNSTINYFVLKTGQISNFNASYLISTHILKPFVVDPRVDSNMKPASKRICAPFLLDRTQTKIFSAGIGTDAVQPLKRPYIEHVISVRFNNANLVDNSSVQIKKVLDNIEANINTIDPGLVAAFNDPLSELYSSELTIFNQYFRTIRALVDLLYESIKDVETIRNTINFQPVPDQKNGIESGMNGGTLAPISPTDANNMDSENDYLSQNNKQILQEISLNVGLQGVPDPGDFVFSNLDDTVFEVFKSVPKSYADSINIITTNRNNLGNNGLTDLQTIEIIMGEFSGLGLIDIVAIQAALWIMDPSGLLGLIDSNAYNRLTGKNAKSIKYFPNIDVSQVNPDDIITSLQKFEKTLKNIYVLIQKYYTDLVTGVSFTSS